MVRRWRAVTPSCASECSTAGPRSLHCRCSSVSYTSSCPATFGCSSRVTRAAAVQPRRSPHCDAHRHRLPRRPSSTAPSVARAGEQHRVHACRRSGRGAAELVGVVRRAARLVRAEVDRFDPPRPLPDLRSHPRRHVAPRRDQRHAERAARPRPGLPGRATGSVDTEDPAGHVALLDRFDSVLGHVLPLPVTTTRPSTSRSLPTLQTAALLIPTTGALAPAEHISASTSTALVPRRHRRRSQRLQSHRHLAGHRVARPSRPDS